MIQILSMGSDHPDLFLKEIPENLHAFITRPGQMILGSYTTTEELNNTVVSKPISLLLLISKLENAIWTSNFNDYIFDHGLSTRGIIVTIAVEQDIQL